MTSPLTRFLIALLATPRDRLAKADPEKLAAKYSIRADWARNYINMRRGL